jgi:glycosyltransferase involved in cell wall biosynthesis
MLRVSVNLMINRKKALLLIHILVVYRFLSPNNIFHKHQVQAGSLKVIHCFRSPVGGLFRHVNDLVRYQAANGIQTGIICDDSTGQEQAEKVLDELTSVCELGVYRIPISRLPGLTDYRSLQKAENICLENQPDIIHGHGAKGGAYSRLLSKRGMARSVYTPHGGALHYNPVSIAGAIFFTMERLLGQHTDAMIFESRFSAITYEEKIGKIPFKYKVIHNGLSETELTAADHINGENDFLYLGEFRGLKGIDLLFSAVAILNKERANNKQQPVKLIVAGGGRGKPEKLIAHIKAMGLEESIEISPPIYPATEAFRKTKCIVVPSRAESLPYIVLEAAAAGVPIITTNVGGIKEIFGPYSDQLIEPDNAELLADAMRATMDNPEATTAKATQLRERVRSLFRIDQMGHDIGAFYSEIINP